jgi:hypothetical protein
MATTFISCPSGDSPVLTSQLTSVKARTDKSKVLVQVVRHPEGDIDEFFSTTLYAFNGIVELAGLGKLIEERFRIKNRIYDVISVIFDGTATEFTAIYCEYDLSSDFDYSGCFWSASSTGIVHSDSAVSLAHWHNGSDVYRVKVVGLDPDGNIATVERDFTRGQSSPWISFSVSDILKFTNADNHFSKVSYFAISYGNLQKIFYIVDDPEYLLFRFRNIFNAPEYIDVVGKVKRKTVANRELALCSGIALQYNRAVNRTYEVTTGPLTLDQAKTMEQLIVSHHVELCTSTHDYDILITDHTCDVDNDDESLVSMKFTFRFVSERPTLFESDMDTFFTPGIKVFSEQFTAEFA